METERERSPLTQRADDGFIHGTTLVLRNLTGVVQNYISTTIAGEPFNLLVNLFQLYNLIPLLLRPMQYRPLSHHYSLFAAPPSKRFSTENHESNFSLTHTKTTSITTTGVHSVPRPYFISHFQHSLSLALCADKRLANCRFRNEMRWRQDTARMSAQESGSGELEQLSTKSTDFHWPFGRTMHLPAFRETCCRPART